MVDQEEMVNACTSLVYCTPDHKKITAGTMLFVFHTLTLRWQDLC